MFKFLFKIIFICILLFGFSNYANYLATGKATEFNFSKPVLPDIDLTTITDSLSDKFDPVKQEAEPIVKNSYLYKWRDEKGIIHYTSEKPSENITNLESIKLSNDTNVVPAVPENMETKQEDNQTQSPSTELSGNVYSPEGIKHLFDQAKNIQNLMNEQYREGKSVTE